MQLQKHGVIITVLILSSFCATSQDHAQRFKDLLAKNDTSGQAKLLKEWESSKPKDPELFIAYFNYYAGKSMQELISVNQDKKDDSFVITDSTGKAVAYLNSSMNYNSAILQKGFDQIQKGIALYPARLDMRFGKIYMLGEAENYRAFTQTIIETIEYASQIKYAWTWKGGKPLEDPQQFFLSSLQDYINTLYNTGNDSLLPNILQIAETVLKYHPDHVESLSNAALTYLVTDNFDKALEYLLKAEKIAPKDVVVLNNIGMAYSNKKDKANARIYFEKIIKVGTKEEADNARKKLKEL